MGDRTRIDACSHIMTESVVDRVGEVYPTPRVDMVRERLDTFDVDRRLEILERYGVDKQVINLTGQRMWRGGDPGELIDVVRHANDEVRRVADEHPDTFIPVGTVPFLTGEYVDEVERCVRDLDMVGIQIYSNIEGTLLDDEAFLPFYEKVNELDVPIWIHPQIHEWYPFESDDWLFTMMGWPFDTSFAVGRLVFSGIMEEYPNLKLVTHHLGGAIPYWGERIASWYEHRLETGELWREDPDTVFTELSEPLDAYFDRVYADTAVSSRGETYTLRCGYEFFGRENVLFAADYPYGAEHGEYWMRNTVPTIEGMDIPEAAKQDVFADNLLELIS